MTETDTIARVAQIIQSESGMIREVVINTGSKQGTKVGDKYLVFGLGNEVIDPLTKESLGQLELVRGRGEVVHVQESMSTLRSVDKKPTSHTRRITRSSPTNWLTPFETVIEELDVPSNEFDSPCIGDLARKIR